MFGHLFTLLTTPLPDTRFANIIKQHKNLMDLCHFIDREFFSRTSSGASSENFERL